MNEQINLTVFLQDPGHEEEANVHSEPRVHGFSGQEVAPLLPTARTQPFRLTINFNLALTVNLLYLLVFI